MLQILFQKSQWADEILPGIIFPKIIIFLIAEMLLLRYFPYFLCIYGIYSLAAEYYK